MTGTKKVTKRGLGKTGKTSVRSSAALTCPPPSEEPSKTRRRPSSLVVGRPSGTLRRFSSTPNAVDADELAVVVRVTAKAKPTPTTKNIAKAPLEPREAFLLSRVDGECSVEDLADLLGLSMKDALAIVRKLVTLDLVRI
jgi:hypothetical protein